MTRAEAAEKVSMALVKERDGESVAPATHPGIYGEHIIVRTHGWDEPWYVMGESRLTDWTETDTQYLYRKR